MMKVVVFCLFGCSLFARNIDILTNWPLYSEKEIAIAENLSCKVREFLNEAADDYLVKHYHSGVDKILIMNAWISPEQLLGIPKEKLILFNWEPDILPLDYCNLFDRVYTYNDDVIDEQKFYKHYFPDLHSMSVDLVPFEAKKLCVMIAANWRSNRIQIVRFFEHKPSLDFEFFGQRCFQPSHRLYRGKIPGNINFGEQKIGTLKKYRFCICFENTAINGYISEKIFACFAAGCIPVYWGAPNIEKYIPKDCFINYRDFASDEEMYRTLKTMSKETYLGYLDRIQNYLDSEQAQLFSMNHFYKILLCCLQGKK